jgi:hypothetical protein
MTIDDKLKTELDENRLLILGTQVLFGFQFHAIFQDQFDQLSPVARALQCSGLTLLMLTVALLIAPSMEHRIVERGQNSPHVLNIARVLAGWALLPVSIALAFDSLPKRGIIPRAQALLGFQLAVTLTKAFSELPPLSHSTCMSLWGESLIPVWPS